MAIFSNFTINVSYREQRLLGHDDLTARARVNELLLPIYGDVPTEAEMDVAEAYHEAKETRRRRQRDAAIAVAKDLVDASKARAARPLVVKPPLRAADFADRDIAEPLDVPCSFCGAEPQQSCVEHGAPSLPHRARMILLQDIRQMTGRL